MLALIQQDVYLKPFETELNQRQYRYEANMHRIQTHFGSLHNYATAHQYYGFQYDELQKGYWFREWAPNAKALFLVGDFNQWNDQSHSLTPLPFGNWEIFLPDSDNSVAFSKVKIKIVISKNTIHYKIPAYIRSVVQNEDHSFDGQVIPKSTFQWTDQKFSVPKNYVPYVYECHIGMATEELKVGSYQEFTELVLPKIKQLGYNTIQIMAIQEHPYYGSFGYQVANFFAPSSRFGMPDDLRKLIDTAHHMQLVVILDVVHSHSVKNEMEGLVNFDGTDLYFNGNHPDWDSKLFDYGRHEVQRFLLSNLLYWMEEFHFDGFRFDGVTSMLYHHHGHVSFDSYAAYFSDTNNDAITYLQLANELIHTQSKTKVSICEDMSGMPGACRPVVEGGLGFDFRLAMGIPDFWIELLKTTRDEDWHMGNLFWRLTDRRNGEKNIGYVESHDQALVGDKTTAFWLMDAEMYRSMSVFTPSLAVDRGIALHKMIRFVTLALGGEGYMNFMGNEFGHPEWVDFPRAGNNWSYEYARRQWTLPKTEHLKYKFLWNFDEAMLHFVQKEKLLEDNEPANVLYEDNQHKILIFSKKDLVFLFNFGIESVDDVVFSVSKNKTYSVVFHSDEAAFGGYERIQLHQKHKTNSKKQLSLYLPNRMLMVLK